jgi:hypothetical protein
MKRVNVSGFLALVVALWALPAWGAVDGAWLETVAGSDVIPEIRMAAGLALVEYYADPANKTTAELGSLACEGKSEAIRTAAGLALERRYVGAGKTFDELHSIAAEGACPELQMATVPALMELMAEWPEDSLALWIDSGTTEAVRYAASRAYLHLNRGDFDQGELEAICLDETASDGYRRAVAELLPGHYLFPPNTAKSQQELEEQARNGENPYLRKAAAGALANLLIQSDMTEAELWAKVASFFLDASLSDEYKWAYERALGARWAAKL